MKVEVEVKTDDDQMISFQEMKPYLIYQIKKIPASWNPEWLGGYCLYTSYGLIVFKEGVITIVTSNNSIRDYLKVMPLKINSTVTISLTQTEID